jgi:hypothetical protein
MGKKALSYHLCPRCYRATPASLKEVYCPNDGTKLLTSCPNCATPMTSPYSRFCSRCGQKFSLPSLAPHLTKIFSKQDIP